MFEAHRKFKTCILCGRYDLTKEHIFGHSFAAYLNVAHHWTAPATPIGFPRGPVLKGSSPITNIAPKLLCKQCNNERLSPLMNDSLPYLKDMSSGQSSEIPPEASGVLKRYFERIALIVDVCTSNEQITAARKKSREHKLVESQRKEPPCIKFADREAWLAGAELPEIKIFIGHHTGVVGLNPRMAIAYIGVMYPGEGAVPHLTKRLSMVIKELAVCIDIGVREFRCPFPSFVSIDAITSWPTTPKVTYDEYYSLRVQDDNTKLLRRRLQDPEYLALVESLSRQEGTLVIPGMTE
jgi:hypothetical protein